MHSRIFIDNYLRIFIFKEVGGYILESTVGKANYALLITHMTSHDPTVRPKNTLFSVGSHLFTVVSMTT